MLRVGEGREGGQGFSERKKNVNKSQIFVLELEIQRKANTLGALLMLSRSTGYHLE